MSTEIIVVLGDHLFSFSSFRDWAANAPLRFATSSVFSGNTLCVDAKGRVCMNGAAFKRVEEEDAFPIKVYSI